MRYCTLILQLVVLHYFQSQQRNVGVQAERLWNALQQHAKEASERKNAAVKTGSNQVPPTLFADGKSANSITTAPSSVVVRLYSKSDQIQTIGDSTTRKGKGRMMMSMSGAVMKTALPSPVPSVAPSTATFAPKGKGGVMSKKTLSPSSSYAPSASIHPTDGTGKGGGMMMMISRPTQSPSVSSTPYASLYPTDSKGNPSASIEPSASLYPTDSKGKGGGMMMSKSKDTFSPTASASPSVSLYPTQEKGMSKKPPPPKDKTPPPTSSLVPTSTLAPTEKMKGPKTKFPTSSPAPSDSIQPTVKGGMMMNMKDGMSPSMMSSKKASDAPAVLPETLSPSPVVPAPGTF
jgi:hypothetical protein